VLFVIDTLQVGGAEQSLLDITTRLKKVKPVICHLYAGEALKFQFLNSGVQVYSVGIKQKYAFITAYRALKKIVHCEQPDVIVAYLTRSELVARVVARVNHLPVIGTFVSDLYGKAYNQSLSFKAKFGVSFFRFLNRITAPYCKGFIANSEAIKRLNAIQLGLPPEKIEVINRGRDSNRFSFLPRIAFPGKPVRFLNVGRLVSVKGQRDLILAFKSFVQHYPGAVLHIAGEGPERASLAALINANGLEHQIELLGNRNDLPQLLQHYDCFIFPSLSEGFSGSVVEAMMTGLPVLASNIPANQEIIQHEVTGYMFQAGSPAAITQAMTWYYNNQSQANQMALAAHAHALQHFELEQIAGKLDHYLYQITVPGL
jgi:glycosyltransferase involved in cell wall biosynthesis